MLRFAWMFVLAAASLGAQTGKVPARLTDRAEETVTVTLDGRTLRALEPLLEKSEPEDADFFRAMRGVNSIEVHCLTFHDHDEPAPEDAEVLRAAMVPAEWRQFLTVTEKDPAQTVTGWSGAGGILLIVAEAGELTSVKVDGLFPENLAPVLGHHFGLPQLGREKLEMPADAVSAGHVPARHVEKLNFGRLVRSLRNEGLEKEPVPLLWLAAPVAFVASGGAVSGTHLAIFKNAPDGFGETVERVLPEGWSRLVEVRSKGSLVSVFVGEVGVRLHLLVATGDNEGGVLVTTRVKASALDQEPRLWAHQAVKKKDLATD